MIRLIRTPGFPAIAWTSLLLSMALVRCGHSVERPGPTADNRMLLPNGWILSPAGKQVPAGDFPMNLAIAPGGRYAVVTNNGEGTQSLTVIDLLRGNVTQTLPVDKSWLGLSFYDHGGRFALSGGNNNLVYLYTFADGHAALTDSIVLGKRWPDGKIWIAGIDIDSAAQTLYAVSRESNELFIVDLHTRSVRSSTRFPAKLYSVLVSRNDSLLYTSVWGGASVAIVNPRTGAIDTLIPVGDHPTDMVETADGRLFVADANENSVAVIDIRARSVTEKLTTAIDDDSPREGSTPNSVALSPDEKTLYVANADNNVLAVFDVSRRGESRSLGFVPTGWYPTCVRVETTTGNILVANGKGRGSRANPRGPNVYHRTKDEEYIGSLLAGTVSLIDPPTKEDLAAYTRTVRHNTPTRGRSLASDAELRIVTTDREHASPIRHVFYIIKENRTYDQVFGDMKEGNGDPSLCIFNETVTPNHHALARQFVLFDNFYCDAEVSADGHNWSMGAYATDYTEKSWPTSYGGRGGEYEFEGGFPIVYPSQGYLWDNCLRHGVSYRSYGEFADFGKKPTDSIRATIPSLAGHVAPFYPPWDLSISDLDRVAQWKTEFDAMERDGTVPQFQIIKLPNDHTAGTSHNSLTPKAYVAQNDLAVGEVVEHISHSSLWATSAIFIVEDDAQNGPDHVDAHRTVALVVSPYTKHGFVDHTLYTQSSMVGTMERILGLPPLSQYDATAYPMAGAFSPQPDLAAYTARAARVDITEKNIAGAYGQDASEKMDFSLEDRAPSRLLNDIIWHSVRDVHAPAPVRSAFVLDPSGESVDGD